MDRFAKWVFLGGLLMSVSAAAGTVLLPPEREPAPGPGETYPESRFGSPPMRVETGVGKGYAARAVEEMEAPDEEVVGARFANRGIASVNASAPTAATSPTGPSNFDSRRNVSLAVEPDSVAVRKGVQEVAVIANDLGFFPKTVFVSRDVPVRMFVTSASKNTLCIMMDSFQVRRQIKTSKIEEITFTPNVPGKYRFYCPVNGMEGTLIVKELASAMTQN